MFLNAGCVGCGKSTALEIISRRMPNWVILPEPLERFEDAELAGSGGRVNYLKEFYDLPEKNTFLRLQVSVQYDV